MKTTRISELPIIPENYAVDNYKRISGMDLDILMTEEERRFINGLIQFYEPQNIIEIGVHKGGGTVNILNAADESTHVVSIDKATEWFHCEKICKVGEILTENYPNFRQDNWKLIVGKDPSEVMEELNMKFDFAVIDSGHFHPCETLNFISILPYLNDGAIVIMHDTSNYMYCNEKQYAPRLLMSSVCADKITTMPCEEREIPNIVAFQVTQDTCKYIQNVFDILLFPWQYFYKKDVESVYNFVKKHYLPKQQIAFEKAINIMSLLNIDSNIFSSPIIIQNVSNRLKNVLNKLNKDTIFYGAGTNFNEIIRLLPEEISFDFRIWDRNADKIKEICNKPVSYPDFETKVNGTVMVITIANKIIANSIAEQFEQLGYTVYHSIKALTQKMEQ